MNSIVNKREWSNLRNDWLNPKFDLDLYLEHLLEVGLKVLNLDIAIISEISGKTYKVVNFVGGELQRGQEFDLGHTYCSITTKRQQLVSIYDINISEHLRHPCYQIFKLEAYVGVPTLLNGKPFGTLNFSSLTPRIEPFSETDHAFVQLMGETINWALMAQADQ